VRRRSEIEKAETEEVKVKTSEDGDREALTSVMVNRCLNGGRDALPN